MRLRSANRGNANNTWNVNSSGNVNNNNAFNANRFSPIVLHKALWPTYSAGCPEDFRQGAEIPSVRINNTGMMHVTPKEPASAITYQKQQYDERIYNRFRPVA